MGRAARGREQLVVPLTQRPGQQVLDPLIRIRCVTSRNCLNLSVSQCPHLSNTDTDTQELLAIAGALQWDLGGSSSSLGLFLHQQNALVAVTAPCAQIPAPVPTPRPLLLSGSRFSHWSGEEAGQGVPKAGLTA